MPLAHLNCRPWPTCGKCVKPLQIRGFLRRWTATVSATASMATGCIPIRHYPAETRPRHPNVSRRSCCMIRNHAHENKMHLVPARRNLLFLRFGNRPAKKPAQSQRGAPPACPAMPPGPPLAGRLNGLPRTDLGFNQPLFPGGCVGAVTDDVYFERHFLLLALPTPWVPPRPLPLVVKPFVRR